VKQAQTLSIATVNVNGLRAATSNGMANWFAHRMPDVITMQEVRAPDALVPDLVAGIGAPHWHVVHAECASKGRAGVAVASRFAIVGTRSGLPAPRGSDRAYDDSGRWVEADLETPDGRGLTVVSCYVHTGDAEVPTRMAEKLAFLGAMARRLETLRRSGRQVVLTGDLNIAHREVDIKNWKGNLKKAGFLPEERAWFDRLFALGWVDVGRMLGGEGPGPYSWWSWRGQAFDTDAGWRIDYHIATPELAATAHDAVIDRAPSYAERWSDHAPVVVSYRLG
jgi:exodeoxyribonuclease-3